MQIFRSFTCFLHPHTRTLSHTQAGKYKHLPPFSSIIFRDTKEERDVFMFRMRCKMTSCHISRHSSCMSACVCVCVSVLPSVGILRNILKTVCGCACVSRHDYRVDPNSRTHADAERLTNWQTDRQTDRWTDGGTRWLRGPFKASHRVASLTLTDWHRQHRQQLLDNLSRKHKDTFYLNFTLKRRRIHTYMVCRRQQKWKTKSAKSHPKAENKTLTQAQMNKFHISV